MWLIDTKTLQLELVNSPPAVKYAILSHTWSKDEVTFKNMRHLPKAKKHAGYNKIASTCKLARNRGIQYAWVDTCCIDKTSSAELSEAINSMFLWYQQATVCFVFLEDLFAIESREVSPSTAAISSQSPCPRHFDVDDESDLARLAACKWFTRGWTLQELIASSTVEFYDSHWFKIFTKETAARALSSITRIEVGILEMKTRLKDVPVAVKMSWAAHRETERPEDRAYSLLGIFDINMPMLYGEGNKAFQRLQEEIANRTNDASLFAWISPDEGQAYRGMFAHSPLEFAYCSNMTFSNRTFTGTTEFSITNRGIHVKAGFFRGRKTYAYTLPLNLQQIDKCPNCTMTKHRIFIGFYFADKGMVRIFPSRCYLPPMRTSLELMNTYIRKQVTAEESKELDRLLTYPIKLRCKLNGSSNVTSAFPTALWDAYRREFSGEVLAEDFQGLIELVLEYPFQIALTIMVYKIKGEDMDVDIYGDSKEGRIIEGNHRHELKAIGGAIPDADRFFQEYKAAKQAERYQQKRRIAAEMLDGQGHLITAAFEVNITEGITIVISGVNLWDVTSSYEYLETSLTTKDLKLKNETFIVSKELIAEEITESGIDVGDT
ncbi:het domain protein [Colletotrichum sp. SAR 10_77]|nr:het domain protein [Colletotrichum sp. SAR 10_75]KAI8211436.1 het domain protein [Colletotrichum sp. SAR 10_76]KAI8248751.1 het domain protein [Colletotrichum sp. SAR 10_77]